jgi:ankyrin repeat protein
LAVWRHHRQADDLRTVLLGPPFLLSSRSCSTAAQIRHWATSGPHVDVARALLIKGAPVTVRDHRFQATPLDWAVHTWATTTDPETAARGRDVAALLVLAGAVPDLERFDPTVRARVEADAMMMHALGLSQS